MESANFNMVKAKWDNGEWNEKMLRALVKLKRITKQEFSEITGIDY